MDIEQRIFLRSFPKTNISSITKAIVFALFIHFGLFISWQPEERAAVEIPQWFNVKLTAGFDEVKEEQKKIKKVNKIKKKINTVNPALSNKENKNLEEKEINKSIATTFIKADSKPYSFKNSKPIYPSAARRRGMQGVVVIRVIINIKGYVDDLNILSSSGFKILDRSAMASIKSWQFVPAKENGKNISSIIDIPIRFFLEGGPN